MEKAVGILLRLLRFNAETLVLATKLAVGFGGVLFGLSWVRMVDLTTPLRLYVGGVVALALVAFLARRSVPDAPSVQKPCPRCDQTLHFAGLECPRCGVLGFSRDRVGLDEAG